MRPSNAAGERSPVWSLVVETGGPRSVDPPVLATFWNRADPAQGASPLDTLPRCSALSWGWWCGSSVRASLIAENELLGQQLAAAKSRLRKRVMFTGSQRWTIALLTRCTASWRTTVTLVQPATVLRWHREGFGLRHGRRSVLITTKGKSYRMRKRGADAPAQAAPAQAIPVPSTPHPKEARSR